MSGPVLDFISVLRTFHREGLDAARIEGREESEGGFAFGDARGFEKVDPCIPVQQGVDEFGDEAVATLIAIPFFLLSIASQVRKGLFFR